MRDEEFPTKEVALAKLGRGKTQETFRGQGLLTLPFTSALLRGKKTEKPLALPIVPCNLINFIKIYINWQLSLTDITLMI